MWNATLFGFTVYNIFWYFCVYAVLGWVVEVVFCTITTGKFVNRGFLNGPVCPIYGFGMVIILLCLTPLQDNLLFLFIGAVLLTSLLELVTGFVLEKLFHTHWWDYSDAPFNLGGYICLSFSIMWGIGAVVVVRLLHPLIAAMVGFMPVMVGQVLAVPILLLFLADCIVTVNGIAKFTSELKELERLTTAMHQKTDVLAENIGDTALSLAGKGNRVANRLGDNLVGLREKVTDIAFEVDENLDELKAKYAALQEKTATTRKRLLKAYPAMKHVHYPQALADLKEKGEKLIAQKKASRDKKEK
ncbi:MAG: putative ABC transporter permease [Oscillospiraceae bacterium]|nr:putative ABC transporter permease [Oscillospiraceae bacterium]